MLEKNENIFYFDAHFHLADCLDLNRDSRVKPGNESHASVLTEFCDAKLASLSGLTRQSFSNINWTGCTCSHSIKEWEIVQALREPQGPHNRAQGPHSGPHRPHAGTQGQSELSVVPEALEGPPKNIYLSYGLHPQSAGYINITENADFLEQLLQQKKLHAIGEAGFDYFTPEFRDQATLQEEMFNLQLDLALRYNMPMVIHARKANHKLFEYSRFFKKLPAVLFHSFMGPAREAQSLIDHGINAYFSFGKQLMNNNKKVLDCAKKLPLKNLLLETDAPFQYLKGEKFTDPQDITKIYDAFMELRDESSDDIFEQVKKNFWELYKN